MAVYFIYLRASLSIKKRAETEGQSFRAVVLGHTHLPFQQQSPGLPLLFDDGDMRHNSTFAVEHEGLFHLMRWDIGQNEWLESPGLRLYGSSK